MFYRCKEIGIQADALPATLNPPAICKIPAPAVGVNPPILTSPLDFIRRTFCVTISCSKDKSPEPLAVI